MGDIYDDMMQMERNEKRSYNALKFYGVPKNRAGSVHNGICVLADRFNKEIGILKQENRRLLEALRDCNECSNCSERECDPTALLNEYKRCECFEGKNEK